MRYYTVLAHRFSVIFLAIVSVGLAGCWSWPPLTVHVDESDVRFDVRRFGEYGTSVSRIQIRSAENSSVLWDVVNPEAPQIPGFALRLGNNPLLPENLSDFGFSCVVPEMVGGFRLERDVVYAVKVYSKSGERSASREFAFETLPDLDTEPGEQH